MCFKSEQGIQPGQKWAEKFGDRIFSVFDYDPRKEQVFLIDQDRPDMSVWCPEDEFLRDHELMEAA